MDNNFKIYGNVVGIPNPKLDAYTKTEVDQKLVDKADKSDLNALTEYANSLKGTASGEVIGITDISPIEHNMGVKVSSNNLIPFPYSTKTGATIGGITATVNDDGSIVINGTATKQASIAINLKLPLEKGVPYTLSGCTDGGNSTYYLFLQDTSYKQSIRATTNGTTIIPLYEEYYITILVMNGVTVDNAVIKPMLEKGTKETAYTPFVKDVSTVKLIVEESGAIYKPNADGVVEGVKSIYPNTTLYTDTSGVLIECEYNRDTNKVIENLVNAIISLGGNV